MSNRQRVVDVQETTGDLDSLESAIVEQRPDSDLPEKFRGKSAG